MVERKEAAYRTPSGLYLTKEDLPPWAPALYCPKQNAAAGRHWSPFYFANGKWQCRLPFAIAVYINGNKLPR